MATVSNRELQKFVPEPVAASDGADRLLALVLYAGLGALASFVFVVATGLVDANAVPLAGPLLWHWLDAPDIEGLARRATAASAAVLAGMIAIHLVLRPYLSTRGPQKLVIAADEVGLVLVDPASVCNVAAAQVQSVRGVLGVKASLIARGSAPLRLRLDIEVVGAVDLKAAGEEARKIAAEAVERVIGLPVQSVLVHFTIVPAARIERVLK